MKRVVLNAKRADITNEAFLSHWLLVHAPLVVAAPGYRSYLERYQQALPVLQPELAGTAWPETLLSVSEFWYTANPPQGGRLSDTPYFKEFVEPDVDHFLDRDGSLEAFVDEEILVPRSGNYRVLTLLRSAPDLSRDKFLDSLQENIAALQQCDPLWSKVVGYARNIVKAGKFAAYSGRPATDDETVDVIEEFCFDTPRDALDVFASPGAFPDVSLIDPAFLRGGRSRRLLVRDTRAFS